MRAVLGKQVYHKRGGNESDLQRPRLTQRVGIPGEAQLMEGWVGRLGGRGPGGLPPVPSPRLVVKNPPYSRPVTRASRAMRMGTPLAVSRK